MRSSDPKFAFESVPLSTEFSALQPNTTRYWGGSMAGFRTRLPDYLWNIVVNFIKITKTAIFGRCTKLQESILSSTHNSKEATCQRSLTGTFRGDHWNC